MRPRLYPRNLHRDFLTFVFNAISGKLTTCLRNNPINVCCHLQITMNVSSKIQLHIHDDTGPVSNYTLSLHSLPNELHRKPAPGNIYLLFLRKFLPPNCISLYRKPATHPMLVSSPNVLTNFSTFMSRCTSQTVEVPAQITAELQWPRSLRRSIDNINVSM